MWDPKSKEMKLGDYTRTFENYSMYNKDTREVRKHKNVKFDMTSESSLEVGHQESEVESEPSQIHTIKVASKESKEEPQKQKGRGKNCVYEKVNRSLRSNTILVALPIPNNIKNAWTSENKVEWREATDKENKLLKKNITWKLVKLPSSVKAIGNQWIFTVKENPDGKVDYDMERGTLKLHQNAYIKRLLKKFGMMDNSPVKTLNEVDLKLVGANNDNKMFHIAKKLAA
ncbi:hypothetical protein AXG93_4548s1120 [Marchantia polymorpha subsp. ruderalis]|uniref:Reverse transcriptase Ty1/copia-type domain-containing protein n=1 Tax=Marchantia polymorpha subsp. ruderalis TaxID=1480154 RepID=A0A176WB36_MARPO|nr:hypothetical protein AXG93_4548s1120 [Marchantia polymorpha subsp. ruderalis]